MYTNMRVILLTLLVSVSGNALANGDLVYSELHAFGTSLSDEGNAFMACGGQSVPPYENLTSFLGTAPGDAPYAKGGHHFSNGSTWVDALAKQLGVNNSALPVLQNPVGTNYAQAGTTAIAEGPLGPLPCRVSFAEQVEAALARGAISSNALVTVEIGSNDVINAVLFFVSAITEGGLDPLTADAVTKSTVLEPAADFTSLGINQLIGGGASTLLWANVPDIGLTPSIAILDEQLQDLLFPFYPPGLIIATATDFAQTYNDFVQDDLQPAIDAGTIVKLDLFQILQELVAGGNGDLNVTDACVTPNQPPFVCRKPDSYVYWDGVHPTKTIHDFIAGQALEALGPQ